MVSRDGGRYEPRSRGKVLAASNSKSKSKSKSSRPVLKRRRDVKYELRSRKVLAATSKSSSGPELKRRRNAPPRKSDFNGLNWLIKQNTNGKPKEGWLVKYNRASTSWFVHPSRLPAQWGPYILPDGRFDNHAYMSDKYDLLHGLVPLVPPAEHKRVSEELALRQPTECAETALAHYNEKQSSDFVLHKAGEFNVLVCSGIWFHINFEAKARNALSTDSSVNLFFAELTLIEPYKMEVKLCVPLDSDDSGHIGCTFCQSMDKKIHHPAQGFERGHMSIVEKPKGCHPTVSTDGTFDFEKWYERTYYYVRFPVSPRRPAQERKEEKEADHQQNTKCAKRALAHYNKTMHKDFELVEALLSTAFLYRHPPDLCPTIWYHANFKAKPQKSDYGDSSTKLFFAEIYLGKEKKVTLCTILEPDDCGDCEFCGPAGGSGKYRIWHPVDGYHGFLTDYSSDAMDN